MSFFVGGVIHLTRFWQRPKQAARSMLPVVGEQAADVTVEHGLQIFAQELTGHGVVVVLGHMAEVAIPHLGQAILAYRLQRNVRNVQELQRRMVQMETALDEILATKRGDAVWRAEAVNVLEVTLDGIADEREISKLPFFAQGTAAALQSDPLNRDRHAYYIDVLRQLTARDIEMLVNVAQDGAVATLVRNAQSEREGELDRLSLQRLTRVGLLEVNEQEMWRFAASQPERERDYARIGDPALQRTRRQSDASMAMNRAAIPRISPFGRSFSDYFSLVSEPGESAETPHTEPVGEE